MAKSTRSHTQHTLKLYRDQGMRCQVVEQWIAWSGTRRDLFGCIDFVALDPGGRGIVGVQCFGQAFAEHLHKVQGECLDALLDWLRCGARFDLVGWRKLKVKRGGKAVRWTPRIQEITLAQAEAWKELS